MDRGKSTTMYSTLNILNEEAKNIITVEDPVEYRLNGVNQIQVNPEGRAHLRKRAPLILRADPDIVLIGEVRDKETATIAIEAALTGHLVLTSLHTERRAERDHTTHRDGRGDLPRGLGDRLGGAQRLARRCASAAVSPIGRRKVS